jgi:uncharacterized protein YcgI (DUF1989 family)
MTNAATGSQQAVTEADVSGTEATSTDTTWAARDHARAQEAEAAAAMQAKPTVPASAWPHPPAGVDAQSLTWAEVLSGGGSTSKVLARGTHLRLRDLTGTACAHLLLFNADQPWERINVADTVKIPWQAYLSVGHPLLSDQGRVLATIVDDDSGRHDALCGGGEAARGRFINLAAKHGLRPRDLPPSVSLFQGVRVQHDGSLTFLGSAGAGVSVTVRCELPMVVLIANVPHPIDPAPDPSAGPLELLAWRGQPTDEQDPLWDSTPELRRALENTNEYWRARA